MFRRSMERARPGPTAVRCGDVCPACVEVTSLQAEKQNEVMCSLPAWIRRQQVSEVRRLTLSLGGMDLAPAELMRWIGQSCPEPIELAILGPVLRFDATKDYSVVGRFASGAVRTLGGVEVRADGKGVFQPFGYWSLIDPDDGCLDPNATQVITSTVDFLAIEVV